MKLVIDISDNFYMDIKEGYYHHIYRGELYEMIRNGTPLPKGHGRLIDADALKKDYPHDEDWDYPVNTNSYVVESIDHAPTIIEADTGEEE